MANIFLAVVWKIVFVNKYVRYVYLKSSDCVFAKFVKGRKIED